ncbi:hypothetical protein [Prevotella sp. S7 MS 2]|uniref:hypothetical protein n=1 Tax=Prevotella sp. S7 MS 2 TaxID=1287488 RepID=UPI00051422B9|nr:hypothetical protein [Prevotella sp. S7 MS 2]KGI60138.1 hypothetical protein HMPREF0671_07815 [Prevotella sp. S7 MS 2]
MKRLITLCLLTLLCILGNAQTTGTTHVPPLETELEKENFLKRLVKDKKMLIGRPASMAYETLKQGGFPIKHMSTSTVGPWSQPDGIEYMTGVIFFDKTVKEIEATNTAFLVTIKLGLWVNDVDFWKSLPDENWMEYIYRSKQKQHHTRH